MEPIEIRQVTRKRNVTITPGDERWYDVLDEEGTWRIGFCQKKQSTYKMISLDGFHPSYTSFYCQHSGKILPVRSRTMGLTVPEERTLRHVFKLKEIEQICGKMSLFQLMANQLQNTPEKVRLFLRTQLLIFIDKIITTPFQILATIKMVDIHINKLFVYVIQYYFKLLESSKRFITLLDTNSTALQLYKATYQMAIVMQLVLGVHKRSRAFYQSPVNRTIKCEAIMDYFTKYEGGGILPFKLFFKTLGILKTVHIEDITICLQTIFFFIGMCEKYPGEFIQGKIQSVTRIILDEIINLIKSFCDRSDQIDEDFKGRLELVSRIETLYFKLFNKECGLRKYVMRDRQKEKETINQLTNPKPHLARMKSDWQLSKSKSIVLRQKQAPHQKETPINNQKITQLQQKIAQLQKSITRIQTTNIHGEELVVQKKENQQPSQPVENLGEEAFLSSLQWALDTGDINTCKKLVSWRRSLLKLGRITGWQIALAVARKTFKSKEIVPEDIIEANYDFMVKSGISSI